MNISGPAAVAKPEMLFYAPGDLTVTLELNRYVFLRLNALPPMTLELKFYTEISSFLHDRV